MNVNLLVTEVGNFARTADTHYRNDRIDDAREQLVKLREYLNNQPELEAGGATEKPAEPAPG